ncbi:hypothetical protein CDFC105_23896 [Clostridioides difficile]|nr:hypothetical protein CDFC105_23896 [Clostridioides difficile]
MGAKTSDIDFVRQTLITALNEGRDELLGELFKLYENVRQRTKNTTDPVTNYRGGISITKENTDDGSIRYNFSDYPGAGGDYLVSGINHDVISFG